VRHVARPANGQGIWRSSGSRMAPELGPLRKARTNENEIHPQTAPKSHCERSGDVGCSFHEDEPDPSRWYAESSRGLFSRVYPSPGTVRGGSSERALMTGSSPAVPTLHSLMRKRVRAARTSRYSLQESARKSGQFSRTTRTTPAGRNIAGPPRCVWPPQAGAVLRNDRLFEEQSESPAGRALSAHPLHHLV